MKVSLKKVEYSARMSEETSCFSADVYVDGVKVGHAKNRGCGGETELCGNFKALEEYAGTLPEREIKDFGGGPLLTPFKYKAHAEDLVDEALHAHLMRKSMKRLISKRTVFTQDGKLYTTAFTNRNLPGGCAVLNTLPENEALELYIRAQGGV